MDVFVVKYLEDVKNRCIENWINLNYYKELKLCLYIYICILVVELLSRFEGERDVFVNVFCFGGVWLDMMKEVFVNVSLGFMDYMVCRFGMFSVVEVVVVLVWFVFLFGCDFFYG